MPDDATFPGRKQHRCQAGYAAAARTCALRFGTSCSSLPRRSTGSVALAEGWLGQAGPMPHRPAVQAPQSSFAGFRFPPEVIMLTVRWYLRYSLMLRCESGDHRGEARAEGPL